MAYNQLVITGKKYGQRKLTIKKGKYQKAANGSRRQLKVMRQNISQEIILLCKRKMIM